MDKPLLRLMPYFLLVVMLAAIGIFLFSRGNDSGKKAKYTSGNVELEMDGTKYTLINDILSKEYVGSQVQVVVSATREEQVGLVKSVGITLAKLFGVRGDADGRYLIDNLGRIYARSDIAEETKNRLSAADGFPMFRIVGADHDPLTAKDLSAEDMKALQEIGEDNAVTITDKTFVTDYTNRREIFAFTSDDIFYKVTAELFLYRGAVYLTTGFTGDKNTAKDQSLTGVKLPEELQARFAEYWK